MDEEDNKLEKLIKDLECLTREHQIKQSFNPSYLPISAAADQGYFEALSEVLLLVRSYLKKPEEDSLSLTE